MSQSALSAKVFAVYLFAVGGVLTVAPNFLLTMFRMAPTAEVWIRVVGVLAFMLGVYAWVAGKHDNKPMLAASVITRPVVFLAFTVFAVTGLASPMLVLFGAVELLGAIWTHLALKADARSAVPPLAARTP